MSGLAEATGEIVAYTDADTRADCDWLMYLVQPFLKSDVVGSGGPNVVPSDDPPMAQCIARAPGGPTHVLLDDRTAEHVPGCNMAFRREALLAIGGFNPIYLRAGDDVDVCWRLQARGWKIGFASAALVWHHHRSSIKCVLEAAGGLRRGRAVADGPSPRQVPGRPHALARTDLQPVAVRPFAVERARQCRRLGHRRLSIRVPPRRASLRLHAEFVALAGALDRPGSRRPDGWPEGCARLGGGAALRHGRQRPGRDDHQERLLCVAFGCECAARQENLVLGGRRLPAFPPALRANLWSHPRCALAWGGHDAHATATDEPWSSAVVRRSLASAAPPVWKRRGRPVSGANGGWLRRRCSASSPSGSGARTPFTWSKLMTAGRLTAISAYWSAAGPGSIVRALVEDHGAGKGLLRVSTHLRPTSLRRRLCPRGRRCVAGVCQRRPGVALAAGRRGGSRAGRCHCGVRRVAHGADGCCRSSRGCGRCRAAAAGRDEVGADARAAGHAGPAPHLRSSNGSHLSRHDRRPWCRNVHAERSGHRLSSSARKRGMRATRARPSRHGSIRRVALAVTSTGDVYFADSNNHVMRRIDQRNVITTVAGNHELGPGFSGDFGPSRRAQLDTPADVAIAADGATHHRRLAATTASGGSIRRTGRS